MIALWWTACLTPGTVVQGRVIAFDPALHSVTVVVDRSPSAGVVDYAGPVETYTLPADGHERGADPVAGALLSIDPGRSVLSFWDGSAVREVAVLANEEAERREDPSAVVDPVAGTVTLIAGKRRITARLDPALPPSAWVFGDEVRLYLEEPPQIARFMNVTRTDIYAK